jgi:hypothetical protein
MMELLGQLQSRKFKYSKILFSRSRYTNISFSFGGGTLQLTAATEEWTGAGSPLTVTITAS